MPESKSMLGKLLNNMFTTEAERKAGTPRKQKIDGATLPDFEAVRRYFGPHGRVVRSEKDGWFITGVGAEQRSTVEQCGVAVWQVSTEVIRFAVPLPHLLRPVDSFAQNGCCRSARVRTSSSSTLTSGLNHTVARRIGGC